MNRLTPYDRQSLLEAALMKGLAEMFSEPDRYHLAREWLNVMDHHFDKLVKAEAADDEMRALDQWTLWTTRRQELLQDLGLPTADELLLDWPELEGIAEAFLVCMIRAALEEVNR